MRQKKPYKDFFIIIQIVLVFFVFASQSVFAQGPEHRTHNLGEMKYWVTATDRIEGQWSNGGPTGWSPQDYFNYQQIMWYRPIVGIGNYTQPDGTLKSKYAMGWPGSPSDTHPRFKIISRAEPPEVYVWSDGKLQRSSQLYEGEVDPKISADMIIEFRFKHRLGFDVLNRTYTFVNKNHDDYVIQEYWYKATFDTDFDGVPDLDTMQILHGVMFAPSFGGATNEGTLMIQGADNSAATDDWGTYEVYTPHVAAAAQNLTIGYTWDGDDPNIIAFEPGGKIFDDTGDPRFGYGANGATPMPSAEFISTNYAGFTIIYADSSVHDRVPKQNVPYSINADFGIQDYWAYTTPGYSTFYDWMISGDEILYPTGWPNDPTQRPANMVQMSIGPYEMAYGDSIHYVLVMATNGISRKVAEEKGKEWLKWYRGEAGADFDDAKKNALIATGKDSLFESIDRALWTWQKMQSGEKIPAPLPSPDLTVKAGPNKVILEWEDISHAVDPVTGVADLDHYNIYRKKGDFLCDTWEELREDGSNERWVKIKEIPKDQVDIRDGKVYWEDTDVVRGEAYHYGVTAVDDGSQNTNGLHPGEPLESSLYVNRSQVDVIPFAPGESRSDKVRIVPNPYIIGAQDYNFTGDDNRLLFVNLPSYCTLRIYTVDGDLLKTIEHESGDADDSWDMITETTQFVSSGVYILQITNARDTGNNKLPDSIEKFVVIR
jgi:hypothetical protein